MLYYTVTCKTKQYDGNTNAEFESIEFYLDGREENVFDLDAADYEVKNLRFNSANVGAEYGSLAYSEATGVVALNDTPNTRNYKLEERGKFRGIIAAATFPDIENFHNYELEIRYNDMTEKTFGASAFGAQNDTGYEIFSDGTHYEGTDAELSGKVRRTINDNGTCTVRIVEPLTADYINKRYVHQLRIQTKDGNYCTDDYDKKPFSVIVKIVDKATPTLSVEDITAVFDGNPVSADKIKGTAEYNGTIVPGTWKWKDNTAPVNVADSKQYTVEFTPDDTVSEIYNSATAPIGVTITPCTDDANVNLSQAEYTYDGTEKKPALTALTVKVNEKTLIGGIDYDVVYPSDMTNAGTKEIKINCKGNYSGNAAVSYQIKQANITVWPKDITKIYGDKPEFELESKSSLINAEELALFAKTAEFTINCEAPTPLANEDGYTISVHLTARETKNLILSEGGTGIFKVTKAPLTVTVNEASREYGAINPPLSVSYNKFIPGEDESVLEGKLVFTYDKSINETTAVGSYLNMTTASGLTSNNYEITYVPGNVTITKISVTASAGAAGKSYLSVVFDKGLEGLSDTNFAVKDDDGNAVNIRKITASSDGKTYTLNGDFEFNKKYTVKITLDGTSLDATHQLAPVDKVEIIPVRTGDDGGSVTTRYTVSFETNGAGKISSRTVAKNSVIKEPESPEKEGFDFAGWYTDKELTEKYDFSEKVTKSITLYAAWTEKDKSEIQIILTIGKRAAQVFGQTKTNDVAPKIVGERTMLPARFVAESLGANVSWNGEKELVTIQGKNLKTGEDITILIYIGSDAAYVNGKEIKLDSAAFVENDRTYTPVRFISEELGAGVDWIEAEQKVVITK